MQIVDVIVSANVRQRYTYLVPEDMNVMLGCFVDIRFGKQKTVGLVVDIRNDSQSNYKYKLAKILAISDKKPCIPQSIIDLIVWFSVHYCVTEYQALQCIVGLKKIRQVSLEKAQNIIPLDLLTDDQQQVYHQMLADNQSEMLLHGVTGSGKTLLYAHLIQLMIDQKKSVIMLIPEISLTPQFTQFFSQRFQGVKVIHSGLTPKKKEEIWNQCLNQQLNIVIGPRSAIFMPFTNLGLIIIDEEHDSSYKQESTPRYYTHEVAKKRANIHSAKLIYGSATPLLETFSKFKAKQMGYYQLTKRYQSGAMPRVHILDLKTSVGNYLIHDRLIDKIDATIKNKQKVLLLMNRRGYSSYLKCGSCGVVQDCKNCETSYTYHSDGYFRCHRCMGIKKMSRQCISCGKYDVNYQGVAIQKVEFELKKLFPKAKITRVDRDLVKTFKDLESSLAEFSQTSDILVGTQMISKGHNFPNLACVGILGIDTMLHFPDFRASERLFQLIAQTAGRAGRDIQHSDVYVQTFNPDHYVFNFAKSHDVLGFLDQEYDFREPFNYPPFSSIINVIFSAEKNETVMKLYPKIDAFNVVCKEKMDIQCIGPKVAPIEKVRGYYRHNVFYKVMNKDASKFKKELLLFPKKASVRCVVDIDPISLL